MHGGFIIDGGRGEAPVRWWHAKEHKASASLRDRVESTTPTKLHLLALQVLESARLVEEKTRRHHIVRQWRWCGWPIGWKRFGSSRWLLLQLAVLVGIALAYRSNAVFTRACKGREDATSIQQCSRLDVLAITDEK